MPLISSFYGILIYIYNEVSSKHNLPHFHAKFNEYKAVYDLEGNLINGELPIKKAKMVVAWAAIHEDELKAAWTAWSESGEIVKIEGLK